MSKWKLKCIDIMLRYNFISVYYYIYIFFMLFIILNYTDYKIIGELQTLTTVVERSQTTVETQYLEI
jgi:hypothetical protein